MHQLADKKVPRADTHPTPRSPTPQNTPDNPEPALGQEAGAEYRAAYGQELAWLLKVPDLQPAVAALLAARIAASSLLQRHHYPPFARTVFQRLLALDPPRSGFQTIARDLGLPDGACWFSGADVAQLRNAWPLCLGLGRLLASGGDDRLDINPMTGVNRYGCSPHPRPDVVSFGSCTASSISHGAFSAAEATRRAMVIAALQGSCASALRSVCHDIEHRILSAFQSADLASAVLTASGTDAALIVTGLLASEHPRSCVTSILFSPSETGSGVPLAVQGCHFASAAPSGQAVDKGEPVSGGNHQTALVTVELRDAGGHPLPDEAIVQACDKAISSAVLKGRVVLHAIDSSKTGLTAPTRRSLLDFARKYAGRLDIVIDACQARVEPALIRAYLDHGFPVLVTGSKFFGAPGFCGAILFPRDRLARIRSLSRFPAGFADYTGADEPFGSRHCPGLLLRWTAALYEMERFARVPDGEIARRLDVLGAAIRVALGTDERLSVAQAPRPDGESWSSKRSVYTFMVKGENGLLAPEALRRLYRDLQEDLSAGPLGSADPVLAAARCQIGQPVQLGHPNLGGLRIAISASQITDHVEQTRHLACVIKKLRLLLDASAQQEVAGPLKAGAVA